MEAAEHHIIEAIVAFAEPLLAEMELELVEVQYRREGHGWVLRLFIDKEQGVSIDDCASVSREVSAYLEVEELIDHAYHLEVSSPGAERPLKTAKDFVRFAGKKARLKLRQPIDGQKVFTGVLQGVEEQAVVLESDGENLLLELENISKARLML
ncbi:ribosome maturation factor RimP [Desulfogranum mediterraneum]|uniref:ribosome maturation factor RimP n=1 Tax=Desulfogranum mediterraneum TaxID=160661 RepID=UPI0004020F92|nr:ribosome maturation factor RimP [Desulfogranum mediterraneum]